METSEQPSQGVWFRIPWKALAPKTNILKEWLQLFTLPEGWLYLGFHIFGALFYYIYFESTSAAIGVGIAFITSSFLLTLIRFNFSRISEKEEDVLSLAMLIRFYIASSFALDAVYANFITIPFHLRLFFWIGTGACSAYFLFRPGSTTERILKFFFIWPLQTEPEEKEYSNFDRIDRFIWIARFVFVTIALGGCKYIWEVNFEKVLSTSMGAGLHEEAYKFILTGSVFMFPKYSQSRLAVLYVSFAVGLGFTEAEDVGYVVKEGKDALMRFLMPLSHSGLTFFTGLAIARQRKTALWWLEMVGGFTLSVGLHAYHNYVIAAKINEKVERAVLFIINLITWITFIALMLMKKVYPLKFNSLC